MNNVWGLCWDAFIRVQGPTLGVVSVILTLAFAWLTPNTTVPVVALFAVTIAAMVLLVVAVQVIRQLNSREPAGLPIVHTAFSQDGDPSHYLLLAPSILYRVGAPVQILMHNDGVEFVVGMGWVWNVQNDGKVQIKVTAALQSDTWTRICNCDANVLGKLSVHPSVPVHLLEDVNGQ